MSNSTSAVKSVFNVEEIRAQFPILKELVHGKPLVYFDNAATSQKPRRVIKAESTYYATINANVHRGVHTLSTKATEAQEAARETIRKHINAKHAHEVIFTSGTTASINLAASSLGQLLLSPARGASASEGRDEVVISGMEHHSNIVPWQLACERHGTKLKVIPITDSGEWEIRRSDDQTIKQFTERTKILAISHVSNTLGTINPVKGLIAEAKKRGIITVVDGAQAIAHLNVDVQDLGCTSRLAKTARRVSTASRQRNTNKTLKAIFERYLSVPSRGAIGHHRFVESTFRRELPLRKFARSGFPRWRTKFFSVRS